MSGMQGVYNMGYYKGTSLVNDNYYTSNTYLSLYKYYTKLCVQSLFMSHYCFSLLACIYDSIVLVHFDLIGYKGSCALICFVWGGLIELCSYN